MINFVHWIHTCISNEHYSHSSKSNVNLYAKSFLVRKETGASFVAFEFIRRKVPIGERCPLMSDAVSILVPTKTL